MKAILDQSPIYLAAILVVLVSSILPGNASITNVQLSPGSITLSGTGGVSNGTYHVLATTNLLADMADWDLIALDNFDPNGNFIVTNPVFPGTPMQFFRLQIATNSTPDFSLVGFATVNGTVTGGEGGPRVTVTDAGQFSAAVAQPGPVIVQVLETIFFRAVTNLESHKTIVGVGTNATIVGPLIIGTNDSGVAVSNIIVHNLHFTTPGELGVATNDGVSIRDGAHHVWVDHCTFLDCADGQLDVVAAADYVTVSWCKFGYVSQSSHRYSSLFGADDDVFTDRGKLRITYHHNWWGNLCDQRMPRGRFGRVHVFNNYYNCAGNSHCIRAGQESQILVQNNFFQNVKTPYEVYVTVGTNGMIQAFGNALVNTTGNAIGNNIVFTPPYPYTLDSTNILRSIVTNWAGAGRLTF